MPAELISLLDAALCWSLCFFVSSAAATGQSKQSNACRGGRGIKEKIMFVSSDLELQEKLDDHWSYPLSFT